MQTNSSNIFDSISFSYVQLCAMTEHLQSKRVVVKVIPRFFYSSYVINPQVNTHNNRDKVRT